MGMAASLPRGGASAASGVCAASTSSAAAALSAPALASMPLPGTAVMRDRAAGAIWGALAADALAMPVHWYYNPADIQRAFPGGVGGRFPYGEDGGDGDGDGGGGAVRGGGKNGSPPASYYSAPPLAHPSSIMTLHSTSGQGRGGQGDGGKSVIGDVINHGKKQYWGRSGTHYHNW